MCPLGVGTSRSTNILKTGEAKLWIFLVGVNQYQDECLSSLRYPALDCQGLGQALAKATQGFPNKEVTIHNDFAVQPPKLDTVRASLKQIVSQTQSRDTILFYFSGHGVLEPNTQQPVLCLADTQKDNLLATGLGLQELLQILETSSAHQQLICLDACHSGAMMPRGARDAEEQGSPIGLLNPTPQLEQVLRQRAAQSKGFCALLSCDHGQKSWEFPGLGHGVFTYYLMRGLLGEAADSQGVIEADGLYKYVYRQTLQYIDKTNQQLRLINQLHQNRGETRLHPEYPLQTPKRIVEGVGELILGLKPAIAGSRPRRQAIVVDGISGSQTSFALSKLLRGAGGFELEYWPQPGKAWPEVRSGIQACLRKPSTLEQESLTIPATKEIVTGLLYLRGRIEEIEDGEAWLVLEDDVRLSRSWLRQELRRSGKAQQIVVLDCPGATSLADWVEDLQLDLEQGQCLVAAAATAEQPELFSQALLKTLAAADSQVGLPVAGWIAQLQTTLAGTGITLHVWLSGAQGVIDILPGNIASVSQDLEELEPFGSLIPAVVEAESQESEFRIQESGVRIQNSGVRSQNSEFRSQESEVELFSPPAPPASPAPQLPLAPLSPEGTPSSPSPPPPISPSPPCPLIPRGDPEFPLSPSLEAPESQPLVLSSEQYSHLEKLLMPLVGAIAPTLIRRISEQAPSPQQLVENLAIYLQPHQQLEFEKRAISLLQESTVQTQTQSCNSPSLKEQAIDASVLRQCERELANLVGPIATFLVQKALKSHPQISLTELVKTLAANIPDPQKALEFKQRFHLSF